MNRRIYEDKLVQKVLTARRSLPEMQPMTSQTQNPATNRVLQLSLGVIVERRPGVTRWQKIVHVPQAVFVANTGMDPSPRQVYRQGECWRYLSGVAPLTLHRKETGDYITNLQSDPPRIYVGIHERDEGEFSWRPFMVTAAPYEAEGYMHGGDEVIEAVPMPAELVELVMQFVDTHHADEPFKKRKRTKYFDGDSTPFARPPGWRETDQ